MKSRNLIGGHFDCVFIPTTSYLRNQMVPALWLLAVVVVLCIACRLLRRKVVHLKGKKVLITGSASGIGRMLANDMVKKVTVRIGCDD